MTEENLAESSHTQQNNGDTPALFKVYLNPDEQRILQLRLPKGFTLQLSNSKNSKRDASATKRLFLSSDGTSVPAPSSNGSNLMKKSLRHKVFEKKIRPKPFDAGAPLSDATSPNQLSKAPKYLDEDMQKCYAILQRLKRMPNAGPFLLPVDPIALNIPDYLEVIPEPMDLSTVENKLRNQEYDSVPTFMHDVRKIWMNSMTYNSKGSEIYYMTQEMSNQFEKMCRKELDLGPNPSNYQDLQRRIEKLTQEVKEMKNPRGLSSDTKRPPKKASAPSDAYLNREMSAVEKKFLGQQIRSLPPAHLKGVWEIVSEGMDPNQQNNEEIEFDIDTLPTRKVRELERFVKQKMQALNKSNKKKANREAAAAMKGAPPLQGIQPNPAAALINALPMPVPMQMGPTVPGHDYTNADQKDLTAIAGQANPDSSESSFLSDSGSS